MGWFNDRHFFLLAVVVYGISMVYSVFLWRKGFHRDDHVNYLLLLFGFGLHTTSMVMRGILRGQCPVTNLYEATAFLMWTVVGVYLLLGLWARFRFIGAFASPGLFALGVFALMPSLDVSRGVWSQAPAAWTSLHAALMSLSYGAFGLGAVAAIMYLTQEHNLKFHKLQAILSLMPSIQRLETAASGLLLAGFILLTIGLTAGFVNLTHINNPLHYSGDPKVLWSGLVWCLYLGLLIMRWRFAQGGRRFALGAICTFLFVLLTFWGTSVLSPLHNP